MKPNTTEEEQLPLSDKQKQFIESIVHHHLDVLAALVTSPISEVSSTKYAELTGIPHKRVKNWCLKGVLCCRRLDNDGNPIEDWSENPRLGHWYIDISKRIGGAQ